MFNNFYLCFTAANDINCQKVNLALEYWEVNFDTQPIKHHNNAKELAEQKGYKNATELLNEIKKYTSVVFNCANTVCPSCKKPSFVYSRTQQMQLIRQKSAPRCSECEINKRNTELAEIVNLLDKKIEEFKFPDVSFSSLINLDYLTKVTFLAWILDKEFQPYQNINLTREEVNLTGSESLDVKILNELSEKKLIHLVPQEQSAELLLISHAQSLIHSNQENTDKLLAKKIVNYQSIIPRPGLYLILPEDFLSMENYIERLLEDVLSTQLSTTDIQRIEELVLNNRLEIAYQLLNLTIAKHKISIDQNIKLDSVLTKLVREYSIKTVFNILDYQAKLTAAYLYSNRNVSYHIRPTIFCKKIESYMNYLETNNKLSFQKNLPDNFVGSSLEYFSSYYILGQLISWCNLSGNEIISKWINSSSNETD
ncbi:hypothetical protein [Rheinheimera salexigens]|uniref:Uncharacterized protein n=1 Tax=Rheinheimera salexigens TaxID=1628148 RepID=A0A1E7Q3Q0_9GAMM|nr:hypothetical protein [Rheinheimera salexigens]OEY68834.1 hypothetical protein BI198_04090 [Rheinheimera salexigens]